MQGIEAYTRISRDELNDPGIATSLQRVAIERYCSYKGWKISSIVEDVGVSGAIPLLERPNGRNLIATAEANDKVIVAYRQDRLFRDLSDAVNTIKQCNDLGITVVMIAENFDLGTPSGRMAFHVMAAAAQYELEMIRIRTRDKMRSKKEAGEQVSTRPPYGMRWQPSGKISKKGKPIMIQAVDDAEQLNLKLMKKLRWAGKTYPQIAALLNADGVGSRNGGPWVPHMVRKILDKQPKRPRQAKAIAEGRKCRECGCTEIDCRQCIEKTGVPCTWVEDDLCSACAGAEDAQIKAAKLDNGQAHDDDHNEKGL